MRTDVVTVGQGATRAEAARLMLAHGINALPVLDEEGRVAGMIGVRDVLRAPTPSYRTTPVLKWTRLAEKLPAFRQTSVRQVMARRVVTADEEATLVELAALMANRGVHPIPILHRGRLLEELDSTALARHRDERLEVAARRPHVAERALRAAGFRPGRRAAGGDGPVFELREGRALDAPEEIARLLVEADARATRLAVTRQTLEEHFVRLTAAADADAAGTAAGA
jgi:CBS domain-containing protein